MVYWLRTHPGAFNGGHQVVGLTRSDEELMSLEKAGAEAWRGDVNELKDLQKAVEQSEGVIHTAFNHDFSKFMAGCEEDRKVITAIRNASEDSVKETLLRFSLSLSRSHRVMAVLPTSVPSTITSFDGMSFAIRRSCLTNRRRSAPLQPERGR